MIFESTELSSKWSVLDEPDTRLRVFGEHPLSLFISKKADGNRCFIIRTQLTIQIEDYVKFKAFSIKTYSVTNDNFIFVELSNIEYHDIFNTFLYDLITSSIEYDEVTSLNIITNRLMRWPLLFNKLFEKKVSEEELLGLLGELHSLKYALDCNSSHREIITGWRGPNGDSTDLAFNNTRIEIKSKWSTSQNVVKISSPDQLFSIFDNNYLVINYFEANENGFSVKSYIDEILQLLHHEVLKSLFMQKIQLTCFDDEHDAFDKKFSHLRSVFYDIDADTFPKFKSDSIPNGINAVTFSLEISFIEKYKIDSNIFKGCLNE